MGLKRTNRSYHVKSELTEEGTFREYAADGAYRETVPGLPGIKRLSVNGKLSSWRLNRTFRKKKYSFVIPVHSVEALRQHYCEWESDPDAYSKKYLIGSGWKEHANSCNLKKALNQWVEGKYALQHDPHGIQIQVRHIEEFFEFSSWRNKYSESDARQYATFLGNLAYSPNTVGNKIRSLRRFFRYAEKHKFHENIFLEIPAPKPMETQVDRRRIVPEDVIVRVIERQGQLWAKHATMVLWSMGLREGEMFRIRPDHVKIDSLELHIPKSKNRKARYVPIPDQGVLNSLLWLGIWNRERTYIPDFEKALKHACYLARVPPCAAHALRHSRITIWVNLDKCDLRDVMRWAGHTSQAQTEKYIWEMDRAIKRPQPTKALELWGTHKLTAMIPVPTIPRSKRKPTVIEKLLAEARSGK